MKSWIVTIAVSGFLATAVAFYFIGGAVAKPVTVAGVELRSIAPSILSSGTLIYDGQVTLVSELVAQVDEVLVKEGDLVTKGQVLLRLDAQAARSEVEQLRASRDQARISIERQKISRDAALAKLNRYKDMLAQGLVEATTYDELSTQRDLAEVELRNGHAALHQASAQLEQSNQRLSKTVIRAPINGRVIQVSIKAGETAVPSAMSIAGGSLMVIADARSLFAEVNVDEVDIARVSLGQSAYVVPAAFPDKRMAGKVDQVAVSPRQNLGLGRTYAVRIRLNETEGVAFHPGMSARAEITTQQETRARLAVPIQAVQHADNGSDSNGPSAAVFVLAGGKALRRRVETGVSDDGHIEIRKGLAIDERVVVGPAKTLRLLRDGDPLQTEMAAIAPSGASAP